MNYQEALTLESMSQAVWYNQWTTKKFSKYLKGRILEVGCGIGNFTKTLTEYGEVFAIDINKDYLHQTKKMTADIARVGFGDIEKGKYFFKNQKFDCIVCLNVLEHIKDDEAALKNLFSLLNEGGFLIILVPIYKFLFGGIDKSIGHFRRYDQKEFRIRLEKKGLKILNIRVLNLIGALGWWFSSKILLSSKVSSLKIRLFNILAPILLSMEDVIEPPVGTSVLVICQK